MIRHARRPRKTKGRQGRAATLMFAALLFLVSVGLYMGAVEANLHGMRFFVFRENGAGASETGITDSQFPGHPGSPGRR
jgi:hypothetical protein